MLWKDGFYIRERATAMGCDIHCFVEELDHNGVWRVVECPDEALDQRGRDYRQQHRQKVVGEPLLDFQGNPTTHICTQEDVDEDAEYFFEKKYEFDIDRNYRLFGALACVRVDVEYAVAAPARGLPSNVSPQIRQIADKWDGDGHNHTWCTLKELLDSPLWASDFSQCPQIAWLYWHYQDPKADRVRLVFWFDN